MHQSKCPHCKKEINKVIMKKIQIEAPFLVERFDGVSYQCNLCNCIISTQMDLKYLKDNIKLDILNSLQE